MSKISSSPERYSFSSQMYRNKLEENPDDEGAKMMIDYYADWKVEEQLKRQSPEWQANNLEYDLLSTDWILEKARSSEVYSQNLYAALCNNEFQKLDMIQVLKEETWGCSWRHAGGVIADMRQQGDYINWYCSGIRDIEADGDNGYVNESTVTGEIKSDLEKLGWRVIESDSE